MEFTPEENEKQLTLLGEVRNRHHNKLVYEGIGQRIMDAIVPVNYMGNTKEITEATLLFAGRQKLGSMAIGMLWGGDSIAASCNLIEDIFAFVGEYPDSDVVVMNRLDARPRGWDQSYFTAGIQQIDSNGPTGNLFPLDGIETADLGVLAEMVNELESLRISGDLSCLSEEGLMNASIARNGPVPLP